jgi:hypothetical protein
VNGLHEDLDRALRALPVGEPPVERARRAGRRLRGRRRLSMLAGVLAVAAVAVGYPALARGTASAPAPATGTTAPGGGDPVLTDGPPGGTTRGPGGLADTTGAIAQGTMGSVTWRASVGDPGPGAPLSTGNCYTFTLSGNRELDLRCNAMPSGDFGAAPAMFTGTSDSAAVGAIGRVAPDVAYLIVTFHDGQQLKLIPVTTHGARYVAWVAPASQTIDLVAAHRGGPYSDSGAVTSAAPFDLPGLLPMFGLWQGPGDSGAPRAARVIGAGTAGGHPWEVTAYEGPWGTCFTQGGGTYECVPTRQFSTLEIFLPGISGGASATPEPAIGSAPPGVASIRLTLSNGRSATVHPVRVGDESLFAFWAGQGVTPTGFTSYDADGHQVGAVSMTHGSATPSTLLIPPSP